VKRRPHRSHQGRGNQPDQGARQDSRDGQTSVVRISGSSIRSRGNTWNGLPADLATEALS
jgi:hypothetical protein